uniref:Uncharacterized protein n=1 Tax=Glossina pallidipes TaxID=7398 RepID=A0A1B0A647_GLOPL
MTAKELASYTTTINKDAEEATIPFCHKRGIQFRFVSPRASYFSGPWDDAAKPARKQFFPKDEADESNYYVKCLLSLPSPIEIEGDSESFSNAYEAQNSPVDANMRNAKRNQQSLSFCAIQFVSYDPNSMKDETSLHNTWVPPAERTIKSKRMYAIYLQRKLLEQAVN